MFVFAGLVFWGTALFVVPAYMVRPFTYQSPRALAFALGLKQEAPFWTAFAALLSALLLILLWRRVSTWWKPVLALGILLLSASAVMARLNYFEWMFHPVASPGFAPAAQAKLDNREMVLAVRFGADARAYPIREMAYHHVVNDVVAGVPVAITY
jgi:hypothetical protein